MKHLEQLTKVLRYAGLNLTPQMLQIILDVNVRELIDTLNARLNENPKLGLDELDEIIEAINKAAQAQAEEAAKAQAKAAKAAKPNKGKLAKV